MGAHEPDKERATSLWDAVAGSVSEGWQRLRDTAANALTRFRPPSRNQLPAADDVDDRLFRPSQGWSMLGGDVFEDERRVVVRLEVPGMDKDDLTLDVVEDALVVRGEKRFERESTEGRWRVVQCAYGNFQRVVPLPAAVLSDKARASYRNGVLRVELPKLKPGRPQRTRITVA